VTNSLNIAEFALLADATIVVEAWRIEYSTYRPRSALGGLTRAGYAQHGTNQHRPARP
jgi:Integrase core domain